MVAIAAWVGQHYDIVHRLALEAKGTRGVATAEPLGAGEYRLRLALDAAIYTRSYRGALPGGDPNSNAEFSVPVAFNPADPARFLPAGQSYLPTAITAVLFCIGMGCVLFARRTAAAAERARRLSRLKAEEDRKRRKHRGKHPHSHHEHHHGASNRPA